MIEYCLTVVGLVYLITHSRVFAFFRVAWLRTAPGPFVSLPYCGGCTGFWIGVVLGARGYWPHGHDFWNALQSGFSAMGLGAMFMALQLSPFDDEVKELQPCEETQHG